MNNLLNVLGSIVEKIVPFITNIAKFVKDNVSWMAPFLAGVAVAVSAVLIFVPFFVKLRLKRKFKRAAYKSLLIKNKIKKYEKSNNPFKQAKIEKLNDKLLRQQNKANIAQKKLSKKFYKKKVIQDELIRNNNQAYTENYSNNLGYVDDRNRISVSSAYIKNAYVEALKRSKLDETDLHSFKSNHKLSVTYNKGQNPELAFASDKKVLKETEFAILLGIKEKAEEMQKKNIPFNIVSKSNPVIIEHDKSVIKITNLNQLDNYMSQNFNLRIQKNVYKSLNPITVNDKNKGRGK